ncbi:copper resistance CopC/CopD family protein [Nocardia sp. alder85J]|uniref:copper resistance CopC/CopD family protein n=1 Tax=Nocardia sp. alder85J TaxID=2862949 RepID=UPI001CD4C69F|nr:copper resistance protein CopC [Nocardia sp. alder85J]MCX4098279.1 copper resistance protein CopC [Nocardia sp. alder85J]
MNRARWVCRGLLGVFVVAALCWGAAATAAAHAVLVATDPAYGVAVDAAPPRVSANFDEAVTAAGAGMTVTDQDGRRVDTGPVGSADGGRTVWVALRPELPTGTYLLSWVVLSADGHTVGGSSVFGVGEPPDLPATVAPARDPMAVAADGMVRMLTAVVYFGVVLGVGVPVVAARVWPGGARSPAVPQLIRIGAVAVAVGSLLVVVAAPVRLAGPGGWFELAVWNRVLDSSSTLPQLIRVLAALPVLMSVRRSRASAVTGPTGHGPSAGPAVTTRARRDDMVAVGLRAVRWAGLLVIVVATAVSGHAVSGHTRWLAVVSTAVHVAAMAVWVAGLVLAVLVWRREERAELLPRLTGVASVAVGALAVTGVYQAWRSVDPVAALWSTVWGRLLLLKVAVVGVALVAVLVARTVSRRWGRTLLTVELACQILILVVTAVLAGTTPARDAYDPPVAFTTAVGPLRAEVTVDHAGVGDQELTVRLRDGTGAAVGAESVSGQLTRAAGGPGPIGIAFRGVDPVELGSKYFVSQRIRVPLAGMWRLRLTVVTDRVTGYTVGVDYRVW